MRRAETDWSETPYPVTVMGQAEAVAHHDRPVAVLWIPDIDARWKWREYAVMPPEPKTNAVGFRKPGAK